MKSLKNWWYNHEIDNTRKTAQKMFDENKTNYDKYDSVEKFEEGMDDMVKNELDKLYENETIQSNYNEIKKPLILEFKGSLLTNKLKKIEEQLMKQSNSSPTIKYFKSQESIRIERENQIEENNRKKASE